MTAAASSAGIGIEDTILSSPPAVPGEMTLWKQTMVLNPPDRGSVSLEMGGVSKKSLRAGLKWLDFQRESWRKVFLHEEGALWGWLPPALGHARPSSPDSEQGLV